MRSVLSKLQLYHSARIQDCKPLQIFTNGQILKSNYILLQYFDDDLWRYGHKPSNHPTHKKEFEHKSKHNQAPSEPVSVFLPFPGTEPNSVSCNMAGGNE